MSETYRAEFAYVEREDGLALEGAVMCPADGDGKGVAVLWLHGNTSRFYDLAYIRLGQEMAALGYTFISCNTHGHDVAAPVWGPDGEATPGGAGWERFHEMPLDLAAWIEYAQEIRFERVVLAGHSYGAAKVVYYQAQKDDPRVVGVVLGSPDLKYRAKPEQVVMAERMETRGE
ncbi:MAG: alpha/beta hydrolase, partial [Chloroflexia bacterium]